MRDTLDSNRRHVLSIIDELTPEQMTTASLPSGWTPVEMVRHLTLGGERYWISGIVARPTALRAATRAGCQDSMPRAAILSLHARLDGIDASALERPDLMQVWGPGFSAYVITANDVPVFTLGRLPISGQRRRVAFEMAEALAPVLAEGPITYREAGNRLGVDPNRLRYAALTGTVALHWAGSGAPEISALTAPTAEPLDAAIELGRRFLHVFGPATSDDFSGWAGVNKTHATTVFAAPDPHARPTRTTPPTNDCVEQAVPAHRAALEANAGAACSSQAPAPSQGSS